MAQQCPEKDPKLLMPNWAKHHMAGDVMSIFENFKSSEI